MNASLSASSADMKSLQLVSDPSPLYLLNLNGISAYEDIEITTRSHPDAFPSALRQKRKTQTKHHETGDQGTLVRIWTARVRR